MLSVDLLSDETDLESVKAQFEANASLVEQREMLELLPLLFDAQSAELSDSEAEKVRNLQEAHELFFHEDADAVSKVEAFREFSLAQPEIAEQMRTLMSFVSGGDVTLEDAKSVKETMQDGGAELEVRIPSP